MSTFLLAWNLGISISLRSTSIIHRSAASCSSCACCVWAKPISDIQRPCAKTWKVTQSDVQTWWRNQCCEEILKHYICIDYRWYYRSYIYHILYNQIIYNTMKTLNTYSGTAGQPNRPFLVRWSPRNMAKSIAAKWSPIRPKFARLQANDSETMWCCLIALILCDMRYWYEYAIWIECTNLVGGYRMI